jgi:uncharacterized protein
MLILRKARCSEKVIDHCVTVSTLARKLAESCKRKGLKVDVNLVEVGGLLHDLGRARTHGIKHAVVGGEMAAEIGLPPAMISVIERHVGAGISKDEAKVLGLPEKSYIPETLEERIVSYADKLIEGNRQVDIEETISKFSRELGPHHPTIGKLRRLHNFFKETLEDP